MQYNGRWRSRCVRCKAHLGPAKTQVANTIFRVWNAMGVQGALVGATPSNVAAGNLATRLLNTTALDVMRYAPLTKSPTRACEESLPR